MKHVIAECREAERTYVVDLYPYGVREEWPAEIIWEVARREMLLAWKKPVTGWCVGSKRVR